jgi:hypothetical protein
LPIRLVHWFPPDRRDAVEGPGAPAPDPSARRRPTPLPWDVEPVEVTPADADPAHLPPPGRRELSELLVDLARVPEASVERAAEPPEVEGSRRAGARSGRRTAERDG